MKQLFQDKSLTRDFVAIPTIAISFFTAAILWVTALRYIQGADNIIPLHYTIYFGIDLLGPAVQLLVLPVGVTIIAVVNTIVAVLLFKQKRILSYILLISSAVCALLSAAALYFILSIQ